MFIEWFPNEVFDTEATAWEKSTFDIQEMKFQSKCFSYNTESQKALS